MGRDIFGDEPGRKPYGLFLFTTVCVLGIFVTAVTSTVLYAQGLIKDEVFVISFWGYCVATLVPWVLFVRLFRRSP